MLIDASELAGLIPHSGSMCLLDGVLDWNETSITCRAVSHRSPRNPMRRQDRLHAVCGIEYVSQAMAAHAALSTASRARPRKGYLASVRNVVLHCLRLDRIDGDLIVEAERIVAEESRALYDFRVTAREQLLLSGRAAAVFEPSAP